MKNLISIKDRNDITANSCAASFSDEEINNNMDTTKSDLSSIKILEVPRPHTWGKSESRKIDLPRIHRTRRSVSSPPEILDYARLDRTRRGGSNLPKISDFRRSDRTRKSASLPLPYEMAPAPIILGVAILREITPNISENIKIWRNIFI